MIPDGVDGSVFTLPPNGSQRLDAQILFVGAIREVKGVDVLVRAIRLMVEHGWDVRLLLVGEGHFQRYRRDEERVRALAERLGVLERLDFAGRKPVTFDIC